MRKDLSLLSLFEHHPSEKGSTPIPTEDLSRGPERVREKSRICTILSLNSMLPNIPGFCHWSSFDHKSCNSALAVWPHLYFVCLFGWLTTHLQRNLWPQKWISLCKIWAYHFRHIDKSISWASLRDQHRCGRQTCCASHRIDSPWPPQNWAKDPTGIHRIFHETFSHTN